MSKVIVIGGHGKVARILSPLLVEQGHTVTSLIRSKDQVDEVEGGGITALIANIETMDAADFAEAVKGHDVVVWSAGAGGGAPERTYRIDRDGAIYSMQGAIQAGVPRYVMVSYSDAGLGHGVTPDNGFHAYAQSKAIADAALRDTNLDWTILGPSVLTLEPGTGKVREAAPGGSVARADAAAVIVQAIADPTTIGQTIRFDNGDTPIAEFVHEGAAEVD